MHRNKGKKNTEGNAFFQREDEYSSVKSMNEAILNKTRMPSVKSY
jgi:hypothetical protein